MRVAIQNIAIGLALSRRWLHSPIVIKGKKDKIHTKAGRLVCILEKRRAFFLDAFHFLCREKARLDGRTGDLTAMGKI